MNAGERRRIDRLEDSVHKVFTELGRFPVRFPHESAQSSYGTIKGYVRTAATTADPAVAIWDIELLHRAAPNGVKLGERTDDGTFIVRNIFQQDWQVDDILVAFETQGEDVSVSETEGLADRSAGDLAGDSAQSLADQLAYTQYEISGALWWGFKPGGTSGGVAYFELTEPLVLGVNAARAKAVNADGSLSDTTVWLIDDDTEETRFEGLAPYTDLDDNAAAHNGYRFFALFVTDDYNSTGVSGWRIIDGEAPLQRIVVTLADGDTIGGGAVKVKESPTDREGYPDNGRFPKLEGEISAGAGGGGYFLAHDEYNLFQGDDDASEKYVVRWSAHAGKYIFTEKLVSTDAKSAESYKTNTSIPAATEAGGVLTLGVGTGQQWTQIDGNPDGEWELTGSTQVDLYNEAKNEAVPADTNVQIKWINGIRVVDWEECP